jgi:hypothetical protein
VESCLVDCEDMCNFRGYITALLREYSCLNDHDDDNNAGPPAELVKSALLDLEHFSGKENGQLLPMDFNLPDYSKTL